MNLVKSGLVLEEDIDTSLNVRFVKVHVPLRVLYRYAELTKLHKPIALNDWNDERGYCSIIDYDRTALLDKMAYFTTAFSVDKKNLFFDHDLEVFFTPAERSSMASVILRTTAFVENVVPNAKIESKNVGIQNLKRAGIYTAAFPLHSHPVGDNNILHTRQLLQTYWASMWCIFTLQPLDYIEQYFGTRIGFYFCWLGFYTWMLLPIGILGLLVCFYGYGTSDVVSNEICNASGPGNLTMCPTCDGVCPYWKLHKACFYSNFTSFFQNDMAVLFAVVMAVWSVVFTELWKRREAEFQFRWHVHEYETTEILRPGFQSLIGKKIKREVNVHGEIEPIVPYSWKCLHKGVSMSTIACMLCLSVILGFSVVIYKSAIIYLNDGRHISEELTNMVFIIVYISPALISLLIIIITGRLYKKLAVIMTNYEVPRTESEWEDSFILKCFLFGFVNNYSTLFYIAFVKGVYNGRPGNYKLKLLQGGARLANCQPGGCYTELCVLLIVIMAGKEIFKNIIEHWLPDVTRVVNHLKGFITGKEKLKVEYNTSWAKDFALPATSELGLVDEYLEMVIQFGFVTMFAVIFPPAAICAMMNNLFEIRIDAWKMAAQWRRPIARRANGIGIWFEIIEVVTKIGVVTNAMIIALTSDFIQQQMYLYLYSKDTHSLQGYVEFTLSVFNVSDFEEQSKPEKSDFHTETCMYEDFRNPPTSPEPYEKSSVFYQLRWYRSIFIFIFVVSVTLLSWTIRCILPDMPNSVKMQRMKETHITKLLITEGPHTESLIAEQYSCSPLDDSVFEAHKTKDNSQKSSSI